LDDAAISVNRLQKAEAIYRFPITTGIPMMNDRNTLPLVATQIIATGTIKLVKSPSGIKLNSRAGWNARLHETGISSKVVMMTEGRPIIWRHPNR